MTGTQSEAPILGNRCTPMPTGLFDLTTYEEIVQSVSTVLDIPVQEVRTRLFWEAIEAGWNIRRAAERFEITPHVYDQRMEELYKHTDAFVFELIIGHLQEYSQTIDKRVGWEVQRHDEGNGVLCYGDGIGTDSLRFALAGYDVGYFDYDGPSAQFAIHRFERMGVREDIRLYHDPEDIPSTAFDVLICREVLEHVPGPTELIGDLWELIKPGGLAVITESFERVESSRPTHLAENAQYIGKTPMLFLDQGFECVRQYANARPMVFRQTTKDQRRRYLSLSRFVDFPVRRFLEHVAHKIIYKVPF